MKEPALVTAYRRPAAKSFDQLLAGPAQPKHIPLAAARGQQFPPR